MPGFVPGGPVGPGKPFFAAKQHAPLQRRPGPWSQQPSVIMAGTNARGTVTDFIGAGHTAAVKFTANFTGTITRLWMRTKVANATATPIQLGVYADNAGTPGTLLVSQAVDDLAQARTANAFSATLTTPLAITAGTTYWLAVGAGFEQWDWQGTTVTGAYHESTSQMPSSWTGDAGAFNVQPEIWAEGSVPLGAESGGSVDVFVTSTPTSASASSGTHTVSITNGTTPASATGSAANPAITRNITSTPASATASVAAPSPAIRVNKYDRYRNVVLGSGPLSYHRLGDPAFTVTDEMGSYSGTMQGAFAPQAVGPLVNDPDRALYIDGPNGGNVVFNTHPAPTDAITIEAWVWNDPTGENNARVIDVSNTTLAPPYSDWAIETNVGSGLAYWGFECTINGVGVFLQTTDPVSHYTWHHFVATFNGVDLKVYVDGQLNGTLNNPGTLASRGMPMYYGRYGADGGIVRFRGLLDEAAIYGRALEPTEIANHFAVGSTGFSLATASAPDSALAVRVTETAGSAIASAPAPTVSAQASANITVPPASATAGQTNHTVQIVQGSTSGLGNASAPAPAIRVQPVASPASATGSAQGPQISTNLGASAGIANASTPTPAVSISESRSVTSTPASASASAGDPKVSSSIVSPATLATGSAAVPGTSVTIPVTAGSATADAAPPAVTTGTNVEVTAPPADATAPQNVANVRNVSDAPAAQATASVAPASTSVVIASTPASASASAPAPSVVLGATSPSAQSVGNTTQPSTRLEIVSSSAHAVAEGVTPSISIGADAIVFAPSAHADALETRPAPTIELQASSGASAASAADPTTAIAQGEVNIVVDSGTAFARATTPTILVYADQPLEPVPPTNMFGGTGGLGFGGGAYGHRPGGFLDEAVEDVEIEVKAGSAYAIATLPTLKIVNHLNDEEDEELLVLALTHFGMLDNTWDFTAANTTPLGDVLLLKYHFGVDEDTARMILGDPETRAIWEKWKSQMPKDIVDPEPEYLDRSAEMPPWDFDSGTWDSADGERGHQSTNASKASPKVASATTGLLSGRAQHAIGESSEPKREHGDSVPRHRHIVARGKPGDPYYDPDFPDEDEDRNWEHSDAAADWWATVDPANTRIDNLKQLVPWQYGDEGKGILTSDGRVITWTNNVHHQQVAQLLPRNSVRAFMDWIHPDGSVVMDQNSTPEDMATLKQKGFKPYSFEDTKWNFADDAFAL
jgi:hypothetical protein